MIYVTIIEDDDELRESLAVLIDGTEGFSCVGMYRDCESAIKHIEDDLSDVILMDIELPGMSGIEGITEITGKLPDVEIIMLTIHEDNESVFESLRNGASGYLVKNIEQADLINAIKEVHEGGAPMSMPIARMVTHSFRKHPPLQPLTDRQQQVLKKLCEGKSYQAIANELFISKATVKFHIKNIYQTLHVLNKAGAVRVATKERLY